MLFDVILMLFSCQISNLNVITRELSSLQNTNTDLINRLHIATKVNCDLKARLDIAEKKKQRIFYLRDQIAKHRKQIFTNW